MNPADSATRGVDKDDMTDHMWWKGPKFILDPIEQWRKTCPLFKIPDDVENDNCALPVSSATRTHIMELLDWKRHNEMNLVITTIAYVLRLVKRLMGKRESRLQPRVLENIPELRHMTTDSCITAKERQMALQVVVRNHQAVHLKEDRQKALKLLKLQKDDSGIFRCRGPGQLHSAIPSSTADLHSCQERSSESDSEGMTQSNKLQYCVYHSKREEILLDSQTSTASATSHQGQLVQHVIRRCIPCQKMNNLPFKYPEMEDLPDRRIQRAQPFEHVGIDYFGPLTVKERDETVKAYGIIMTCTVTRLLHLELVSDMTTANLLNALRRFFAKRGVPTSTTLDNGPYVLLGEQILQDAVLPVINDKPFANAVATKGITWKTIAPYAPWQGAFYERLIKSAKHSLYLPMFDCL